MSKIAEMPLDKVCII